MLYIKHKKTHVEREAVSTANLIVSRNWISSGPARLWPPSSVYSCMGLATISAQITSAPTRQNAASHFHETATKQVSATYTTQQQRKACAICFLANSTWKTVSFNFITQCCCHACGEISCMTTSQAVARIANRTSLTADSC